MRRPLIGQVRGVCAAGERVSKGQKAKSSLKRLSPSLDGCQAALTRCVCFDKPFVGNEKGVERKVGERWGGGLCNLNSSLANGAVMLLNGAPLLRR